MALLLATSTPAGAQTAGWQVEVYGTGSTVPEGTSTVISARGSGGVYLRRAIDPTARYRLTVAGSNVSGQGSLRLRIGSAEPRWLATPNPSSEFSIADAASVEALIYTDSAFAYKLDSITLEPCPTCQGLNERASLAQPKAPGWTPNLYGDPALSLAENQDLRITVASPPGGVTFDREELSRMSGYRLRIDGAPVTGSTTYRIEVGNRTPVWVQAGAGVEERVVYGASKVKVWIYGDQAFAYDLKGLTLESCGSCLPNVRGAFFTAVESANRSFKAGETRAGWAVVFNLASYVIAILLIMVALGVASVDLARRLITQRSTAE